MPRKDEVVRDDYDVLVVGAGPTGLTLANLLISQGVRVAVVDPTRIVCHHPRASHIDDECMRLFQTLGLSKQEPGYLVQRGLEVVHPDGEVLINWDVVDGETDQGWQSDYQMFQPDVEAVLRGRLAKSAHADLWLGWEIVGIDQDSETATLVARERRSGADRSIRAAWVVGCDGSNSRIRELVAERVIDMQGTQRSVIIDVQRFGNISGLPEFSTYIRTGSRPVTHQPAARGISRFQFMLVNDQDFETFEDPEVVYELLTPYLAPDQYRILRTDVYEWHSRMADGWRSGRIMIAGDAAHQMPPTLGQGMCSGLRDAANLGWKLAAVLNGRAAPALLDTFESERRPHVEAMISESTRQARLIADVGRGNPVEATGAVDRTRGGLGPGLGGPHPRRGQLAPQPRNADGQLLDDVVGYGFAIVGDSTVLAGVEPAIQERWQRLGAVVVPDFASSLSAWLSDSSADAAIIRPDRYVFAATRGQAELVDATCVLSEQLSEGVAAPW
jgi:3-(3-hydroxy-phenyl)propionate hydroxylase